MDVYLMKTFQEWAERFIDGDGDPYVALDEKGVDTNYGEVTEAERRKLFKQLEKKAETNRRWGLIKTFFDRFYFDMKVGDILVLGVGQVTKFNVYAIVRIKGEAYYTGGSSSKESRHRRDVEVLWAGEPFPVSEWGWARRIEVLDTKDRLKQYIAVSSELKWSQGKKLTTK